LWAVHLVRAELRRAAEIDRKLLRRAQTAHDPVRLIYARMRGARPRYFMGAFLPAREISIIAISLYDPERHRRSPFPLGGLCRQPFLSLCAAWNSVQLGLSEQGSSGATKQRILKRCPIPLV